MTTPALSHVRVVVQERSSFWGDWPWWDTSSYTTTYTVCGSCHHSRCCCSHDRFLNSTEGIIATFIVSAVALAIRLLQENNSSREIEKERTLTIKVKN